MYVYMYVYDQYIMYVYEQYIFMYAWLACKVSGLVS